MVDKPKLNAITFGYDQEELVDVKIRKVIKLLGLDIKYLIGRLKTII